MSKLTMLIFSMIIMVVLNAILAASIDTAWWSMFAILTAVSQITTFVLILIVLRED